MAKLNGRGTSRGQQTPQPENVEDRELALLHDMLDLIFATGQADMMSAVRVSIGATLNGAVALRQARQTPAVLGAAVSGLMEERQ